jgi:hypothetical protein
MGSQHIGHLTEAGTVDELLYAATGARAVRLRDQRGVFRR